MKILFKSSSFQSPAAAGLVKFVAELFSACLADVQKNWMRAVKLQITFFRTDIICKNELAHTTSYNRKLEY